MFRVFTIRIRSSIRHSCLIQTGLIFVLWLLGQSFVRITNLPVPGSIVGLACAIILLASHRISIFSLRRGAEWFLAQMLLFFLPAVLAVIDHREFLGLLGLKIMVVILAGTTAVMCSTALTVELCDRWRSRHEPPDSLLG